MIAFIQGELCDAGQDTIVVACHGIGYEIQIPVSVAQVLPDPGNVVKIYTYTYVREDALGLFGFLTKDDLKIFKLLITVNGVGPKAALAILSAMTADELRFAILAEDAKAIAKAPGIGPKTAKRMIIELKDKLNLESMIEGHGDAEMSLSDPGDAAANVRDEVIMALTALGYGNTEAVRAVRAVSGADEMDSETLLKQALKKIMIF
ncbi:MAG: Holliday junction branch migration protein RuvA [Coprococcus catus]|uniref:Holliday junction branch migration complex subunit RuvA n=1 Tax=Coprococcus intestinihominis TaxID=3133154 RepID=A0ABV1AZL9_9FIRM|nr:Holliday junction branch migration protein RuvA [Coprococcus catus]MDD6342937.1 Holliday junction branch migration protein RuvA [Coprococcus catus]